MADDIIPAIQSGGQAGAQRGNAGGVDYRQLQNPESVRTDLPDSGAAARAAELSSVFNEFEGISDNVYTKASAQAGALAGAASGATGSPQYKQGLARFSAYSQAFNNAATGAYAIQAEAQADDAAARLRVQANNNPATFQTTYSAVRDAVLKNAPAQAVPMLTELYNKHLALNLAAISGDQAAEQQRLQRSTYDEGISRQASRVAELQGSANPQDHLAAMDEHTKLSALIDGGVNAGLYSVAEGKALQINTMRQITSQVFSTQVDRELARPDGDVVTLLNRFRQAHLDNLNDPTAPPILSEGEYQKLMQDATTKLREWRLTEQMEHAGMKTAEQLRFEASDKAYTAGVLQHQVSDSQLASAIRNGDLKPETGRALHGLLAQGDTNIKSNPQAIFKVKNDPQYLNLTANDVAALPGGPDGINFTDKLHMIDDIDKRNNNWEGEQAAKDAKAKISIALKVAPGALGVSDEQKKAVGDATQEFIGKINALPAAQRSTAYGTVAQDVIRGVQQKEAAEQIQNLTNFKQSALKNHGPGSADVWSAEKMQDYQKKKDDAIASLKAAGK